MEWRTNLIVIGILIYNTIIVISLFSCIIALDALVLLSWSGRLFALVSLFLASCYIRFLIVGLEDNSLGVFSDRVCFPILMDCTYRASLLKSLLNTIIIFCLRYIYCLVMFPDSCILLKLRLIIEAQSRQDAVVEEGVSITNIGTSIGSNVTHSVADQSVVPDQIKQGTFSVFFSSLLAGPIAVLSRKVLPISSDHQQQHDEIIVKVDDE
jgi:hypothetical protein